MYIGKIFFKSSPKDIFFIDFRVRLGEGGAGRERNVSQLPPVLALTRDQTHNLSMCPDQELNSNTFGAWDSTPTNRATWQGLGVTF